MAFTDFLNERRREKTDAQRNDMFLRRVGNGKMVHYELSGHATEEV